MMIVTDGGGCDDHVDPVNKFQFHDYESNEDQIIIPRCCAELYQSEIWD